MTPVSAPPDRSTKDLFRDAFLGTMRLGQRFPKFAESRSYDDLLADFAEWYERDEGNAFVKGTTREQMAQSVLVRCPDAAVSAWIQSRSAPIPSAAKPTTPQGPVLPAGFDFVAHAAPVARKETIVDNLPCGCSKVQVAAVGHYSNCAVSVQALQAIVDDRVKSPPYYGKSVVAEFLKVQREMNAVQEMLNSRRQIRDATAEEERKIARMQADLDNHSGKPFTLGPGLALRETVRGCRRCRIRRFGAVCNGCGDPVTSFDLRPGESGW